MLIGEWLRRVHYRLNRRRLEAELREEMDAHREVLGTPARFGNELHLRERSRAVWGWSWLDGLGADVRIAARGLTRRRGFTAAAAGSLALGFALVASTLAVTNAYLMRS